MKSTSLEAQLCRQPVDLNGHGDRFDRTGKGFVLGHGVVRRLDADEDRQTKAMLGGVGKRETTTEDASRITELFDLIRLPTSARAVISK